MFKPFLPTEGIPGVGLGTFPTKNTVPKVKFLLDMVHTPVVDDCDSLHHIVNL
jgi:hypothetical protein